MSSKIDFNILLARADKNTNNACKLLEEKKLLNQKTQQKNNQQRNELHSKAAALAFIKQKKEEIRMRTEQEARELLERKHQKDQLEIAKNATSNLKAKKPGSTQHSTDKINSSVNKAQGNSEQASKKPVMSSKPALTFKSSASNQAKAKTNTTTLCSSHLPKAGNQSSKKPVTQNSKPIKHSDPKPKMSYDQILKIADTLHKEKVTGVAKSEGATSSSLKKNETNQIAATSSTNFKAKPSSHNHLSSTSNNNTVDLKKKQLNNAVEQHLKKQLIADKKSNISSIQNNTSGISSKMEKPQNAKETLPVKSAPIGTKVDSTKGLSSWDRIISDMKKKPTKNNLKKTDGIHNQEIKKQAYEEYEDDEYDSEMDDFIDDEEYDDDVNDGQKKDYSKCIQEIFNYNPKRYKAIDDDDIEDMETDYHSQLKEEKRSLKMGILEDLEELKKEAELEKKRIEKQKLKRKLEEEKNSNIKKLKSNKT